MLKFLLVSIFFSVSLFSFESTNIQLLYSNNFKGDAYIYDTVDGKKTTFTFEHFRTFSYGDVFMFVDMMQGKKLDASSDFEVYTEIAPRLSFSKILNSSLSWSFLKDYYIATQLNMGNNYRAYLIGLGVDIELIGFDVASLNFYSKSDNFHNDTYQVTAAYISKDYFNIHFEGFMDITEDEFNTQNQLLYNFSSVIKTKEQVYAGIEWIYYNGLDDVNTNAVEAMIKYKF